MMPFFDFTSARRAGTRIQHLRQQLHARYPEPDTLAGNKRKTYEEIQKMLQDAQSALDQNKTELAWQHFHSALRTMLKLDSEAALKFKRNQLRNESSEKLSDWRRKTVLDSLEDSEEPDTDTIIEGYRVLHEHFSNVYIKNRNILSQLAALSVVLSISLLIFLLIISSGSLNLQEATSSLNQITLSEIMAVLVMGSFGACLSAIFSLTRGMKGIKIPEQQINYWVTLSRPLVGAVSGIVIYLFVISELIFPNQIFNNAGFLSISFVAGFSERLVIYAVSIWSSGPEKDEQ